VAMAFTPAQPAPARERLIDGSCASPHAASVTLCLINRERAARRLPPLAWQPELAMMAIGHSEDMLRRRFFSHVTPDGADFRLRVDRTSYVSAAPTWRVGEVLAWASEPIDTPADIVAAWLASPLHRRLLLDRHYRDIGVGVVAGIPVAGVAGAGATYTAELGTRRVSRAYVTGASLGAGPRRRRRGLWPPAASTSSSSDSRSASPRLSRSSIVS
jgi:Cysteine-rich secretory protein family